MRWPSKEEVKKIKKEYPPGTVIKLIQMDDPTPVPSGAIGVITSIDDIGQLHVNWKDYMSSLAVVPAKDNFRKIGFEKCCEYCENLSYGASFECSKDKHKVDVHEEFCEDFMVIE